MAKKLTARQAIQQKLGQITNMLSWQGERDDAQEVFNRGQKYEVLGVPVNPGNYIRALEDRLALGLGRAVAVSSDPAVFYGRAGNPARVRVLRTSPTY